MSSRVVERDLIVVVVPVGFDLRTTDSRQLGGRTMISCTTDLSGEELDRRLVAPGASPNRAATGETAVRLGRLLGCPVLLRAIHTPRLLHRRGPGARRARPGPAALGTPWQPRPQLPRTRRPPGGGPPR